MSHLTQHATHTGLHLADQSIASIQSVDTAFLSLLSSLLGWCYFAAWSISFYPQLILNFQRKSVSGLSLDFQFYNATGFLFYTVYSLVNYVEERKLQSTVVSTDLNDIAFAAHALTMTLLTLIQCLCLYYETLSRPLLRRVHKILLTLIWTLSCYNFLLVLFGRLDFYCPKCSGYHYSAVEFLGYCKLLISAIKYIPQVRINYLCQSTVGFSHINVWLDLSGGLLSFAQQAVDCVRFDWDFSVFTSNVVKLLLSIESVMFDLIFLIQHYCLYADNNVSQRQKEALLRTNELKVSLPNQVNDKYGSMNAMATDDQLSDCVATSLDNATLRTMEQGMLHKPLLTSTLHN